jgi:hypothetical protein
LFYSAVTEFTLGGRHSAARQILKKDWLEIGAGGPTRTGDLLITNQLLYQLSYTSIREKN